MHLSTLTRVAKTLRTAPTGVAADIALGVVSAGWILATATTQTPYRILDRARNIDLFSNVIPNWMFFAPEPARHDFRVLYRCSLTGGGQTPWTPLERPLERRLHDPFWMPARRQSKALTDYFQHLNRVLGTNRSNFESSAAYRVLAARVRKQVLDSDIAERAEGYQFMLATDGGFDVSEPPEFIAISRHERLDTNVHPIDRSISA